MIRVFPFAFSCEIKPQNRPFLTILAHLTLNFVKKMAILDKLVYVI